MAQLNGVKERDNTLPRHGYMTPDLCFHPGLNNRTGQPLRLNLSQKKVARSFDVYNKFVLAPLMEWGPRNLRSNELGLANKNNFTEAAIRWLDYQFLKRYSGSSISSEFKKRLALRNSSKRRICLGRVRGSVCESPILGHAQFHRHRQLPSLHIPLQRRENAFEYLLIELGIRQKNGSPGHPQTQGKIERFYQTLKNWLRKPPAHTLEQLQHQLDEFQEIYNNHRPHQSLDRRTPQQAYQAGVKASPHHTTGQPAMATPP